MKEIYKHCLFYTIALFNFFTVDLNAQHITGGGGHSMVICNTGMVQAWGNNNSGQLGDGTTILSFTPVTVNNLNNVIAVSAGMEHSLALKNDSTVWAWGNNTYGQLGNGNNTFSLVPVQVTSLSGIVAISCGLLHSVALKSDGTVYAWGYNMNGELGNGINTDSNLPVQVTNLAGIIAITGGNSHVIALKNDSTVWTWGSNSFGELGNGSVGSSSNVPVMVSNLHDVIKISAGSNHSLALKADTTVWSWGYNYAGQLGNSNFTNYLVPVQVIIPADVTAIAGGGNFSLALKTDSTVWAWGDNFYEQLGSGTAVSNSPLPIQVVNLQGVVEIEAALAHSIVIENNALLKTWGYNNTGQLGNGSTLSSNVPVAVISACVPAVLSAMEINADEIKLFPTLSNGKFKVFMQVDNTVKPLLYIYNSSGQLILNQHLEAGENTIDLISKTAGLYFTRVIENDKTLFIQKIVIQN